MHVKAKGKHVEHVFAHNSQFVVTFNACITVVMYRLTHVVRVSQGSVMTRTRRGG